MNTKQAEFDLLEAIAVLERTPAVLDALLRGLPAGWTRANEGPETWSPTDVVGHLLHGEETDWIPRARLILEHGEAQPFTPFDRRGQFEKFSGVELEPLLTKFRERRGESLRTLESWHLTPDQFMLTGTHPEFGRVTLAQLLATWTAHDLGHLVQVARVMAKRYTLDVGPWTAYLSVLTKR